MSKKAKKCHLSSVFILLLAFITFSCNIDKNKDKTPEKVRVFVSILPQKYFVEKIGDGFVKVEVMTRPGQSPHTYEPTPKQMTALAQTDIFFSIGVTYEEVWLPKLKSANPKLKIIPTYRGIKRRPIEGHSHAENEFHKVGEDREALDPHIWLSPKLVKIQADVIAAALMNEIPSRKAQIQANLDAFKKELDDLDKTIHSKFEGIKNRAFLVFHPSWGYFADDYCLKQIAIEKEGKEPSAKSLNSLIALAKKNRIRVVFVQEQFTRTYAEAVAKAIGGKVISIDPLAEDYINNLFKASELLADAMR